MDTGSFDRTRTQSQKSCILSKWGPNATKICRDLPGMLRNLSPKDPSKKLTNWRLIKRNWKPGQRDSRTRKSWSVATREIWEFGTKPEVFLHVSASQQHQDLHKEGKNKICNSLRSTKSRNHPKVDLEGQNQQEHKEEKGIQILDEISRNKSFISSRNKFYTLRKSALPPFILPSCGF